MLAVLITLPFFILLIASAPRGAMEEASTSYEKATASVAKATRGFKEVQTIGAKDVMQLRQEGKRVLLVDVRTEEEMGVSMLRGAVTREEFEKSSLGEPVRTGGKFREPSTEGEEGWDVVVPYCTAGLRSGQYAEKLLSLGYPSVKNSEGVVLWTHDVGSGFVAADANTETAVSGAGNDDKNGPRSDSGVEVKRVHVYGAPWDHASEDFETVKFTPQGWLGSTVKAAFSKIFGKKET